MTRTIGLVARSELRHVWRDGRLRIAACVLMALLLTSLPVAFRESERLRSERSSARAASRQQWLEQGEKNPHAAAHFGMYAFREPGPLAFFDRGVLSYAGAGVFLEAHEQNLPMYAEAADGTLARRLGEWTPARVLSLLVPLLLVLLAFGTLASESERGLLRSVRSLGSNLHGYVLGKFLGLGAAVALLLVPVAALGLFTLGLTGGPAPPDLLPRLALIATAYGIYLTLFLAICVATSALSPSSRRALVLLLGLWTAWTLLLPRGAAELARWLHPAPSASELDQRLARELGLTADSPDPYERRIGALQQRVLEHYGVARVEDLPINFGGEALLAGEEWGNAAFDRYIGGVHLAYRDQRDVLRALSWLSPTLSLSLVSMTLSGTSLDHELDFLNAAEQHRRDFVRRLNEDVRAHVETAEPYLGSAQLWGEIPDLEQRAPRLAADLRGQGIDAAALVGWLVLALGVMLGAASRLDRRLSR